MKQVFIIFTIMMTTITMAQNGKATTEKSTFNRTTAIQIEINADVSIVWALLTEASDYPRWNSTIISIEGTIALGEKIKLKSTLDSARTFKLKVKEFEVNNKLVWGDDKGEREYNLVKNESGSVTFSMVEKIGGLMFPMYAKYIPSFDESFEEFAADLKKEAEKMMSTH